MRRTEIRPRSQELISRTPGYSIDNLFLIEKEGELLACLGFWDWSQVIEMKVIKLKTSMKPRLPRPGEVIKQIVLTPISFVRPDPDTGLKADQQSGFD